MLTCPTCRGTGLIDPRLPTPLSNSRARRTSTDTQEDAVARISPDAVRQVHIEILKTLERWENLTGLADYQIARKLPQRSPSTLRARRSELMHANMVADTGHRRILPDTGRATIVWALTPLGKVALANALRTN